MGRLVLTVLGTSGEVAILNTCVFGLPRAIEVCFGEWLDIELMDLGLPRAKTFGLSEGLQHMSNPLKVHRYYGAIRHGVRKFWLCKCRCMCPACPTLREDEY